MFDGLDVYLILQHFCSTLILFFNPPRRFFNPGLEKNVTPTKSTHGPYIQFFFFFFFSSPWKHVFFFFFLPWKHVFSTLELFFQPINMLFQPYDTLF